MLECLSIARIFTMPHNPGLHLLCHPWELQTVIHMRRTWNRPARVQMPPVLAPTEPWEGTSIVWSSMHYDAASKQFLLWYEAWNPGADRPPPLDSLVCFATSVDGLQWNKPELGLFEWNGSSANNICWMMHNTGRWRYLDSPCVLVEPSAPADRRYRMVIYTQSKPEAGQAFFVLTSPNGINWTWHDEPFLTETGDRFHCIFDDRRGEYWLTSRRAHTYRDKRANPPRPRIRSVERWRSTDLRTWSGPDIHLLPDDADPPDTEFYSLYPMTAGNAYLGYLEFYDRFVERLHTELVISRDGNTWLRPERTPWLDRGTEGAWDDMWVFPTSNDPLVVGDHMLVPYVGRATAHAGVREPMRPPRCSLGLLTFGRDRWAALTVGQDGGEFVTEPAPVTGDQLVLNVDAEFGDVRVAVLDEFGGPINGFSHAHATPIVSDALDVPVRWQTHGSVASLYGRTVRLYVKASRASVYAYSYA